MDLQADLKWIHKELDRVEDPELVYTIKKLLKSKKSLNEHRVSVEQYNDELDVSIGQIANNKTYTHQDMQNRIKKWAEK